jgi:hypothetical protein
MSQLNKEAWAKATEKYRRMSRSDQVKEAVQYGLKEDLPENVMLAELTKIATYRMLYNPVTPIPKGSSKKRVSGILEGVESLGNLNHV